MPPAKEAGPSYETVVVGSRSRVRSATLTDTPWIELPQSVQVVTSRTLESWAVDTPNEAWKLTSGVFPSDQELQSRYGGLGRMRGVQGSQTLLNGFTMPQRMSLHYDLTSVGAMEILKGPADALDGTQTPSLTLGGFGGQINLTSRAPERRPSLLASLAARGLGDRRLRLTLQGNRPLHETLWARIDTAAQIGQRFYVPSSYPAEWSFSTAPAIVYRPSSRFSLTVRGQWMQQKGYAYKGVPVLRGELLGDYDAYLGNKDSTYEYSSGMAQLEAVGRLNRHVSLHAAASYMHTSLDYSIWSWGTSKTFTFDTMYTTKKGLPAYGTTDSDGSAIAGRVYAVGSYTTGFWKHEGLVGLDLERSAQVGWSSPWLVSSTPVSLQGPVLPDVTTMGGTTTGPSLGTRSDWDTVRNGGMAQYQTAITRFVRLLAGARIDHHLYRDSAALKNYHKTEPSWRAGLTILPLRNLALYGNYTTARSPNFGLQDARGQPITESQRFRQAELGVKAELFRRLQLSGAGFYIWSDKMPVALPTQPGTSVVAYELTGETTYRGLELGASGQITRIWDIMASYTYLDLDTVTTGANHNLAPHTISAWSTVALPRPLAGLRFGVGYRYAAERHVGYGPGGVDERNTLPAYHLVDAMAEYPLSSWLLRLNVQNALDTKYYTSARQVSEIGAGEPRSVTLSLQAKY